MKRVTLIASICAVSVIILCARVLLEKTHSLLVNTNNSQPTSLAPTTLQREVDSISNNLCPTLYKGFCLNGGECYIVPEENVAACNCIAPYGGQRCELYSWYE